MVKSLFQEKENHEQVFQRLMITYNGRVGMCCHDWGAQHGVGYVNKDAFKMEIQIF